MNYNFSEQENKYWCFPACLQAVLRRHRINESQEVIAEKLGVDNNGTQLHRAKGFLIKRDFDFCFYNYNEIPHNEPDFLLSESVRRGLDVLVAVPGREMRHVLLLKEFKDPRVILLDPEKFKEKTTNLYDLISEMQKSRTGGFGVIKRL